MKYRILMVGQCHLHGEEILAMTQGVVQIQLSKSHGSGLSSSVCQISHFNWKS